MGFFTALAFLTTIPTPRRDKVNVESYGRSAPFFPLVGLLIGLILVGLDFLLGHAFPPLVVNALLVATILILTGALHLDGFIDCCDGLLSAKPPEVRQEIMKDSRVGAFGVAGAGVLLLVQFAALVSLPLNIRPQALLLAPILSRWCMAFVLATFPSGGGDRSLGRLFKAHLRAREAILTTVVAVLATWVIWQVNGLIAFALAGVTAWLVAKWALGRIPGLTGDVYGAVNELSEVAVLLLMPAIVALSPWTV